MDTFPGHFILKGKCEKVSCSLPQLLERYLTLPAKNQGSSVQVLSDQLEVILATDLILLV